MILKQAFGTKICGQYCLAMILNISILKSVELIGHKQGTKTKELTKYFKHGKMVRGIKSK